MHKKSRTVSFKQADVIRLIKAVHAAGLQAGGVMIGPDGTIEVVLRGDDREDQRGANPCDRLLRG